MAARPDIQCPPRKKRKLNDDDMDYMPSEENESDQQYEPSDNEDGDLQDIATNSNSNSNSNNKEDENKEMEDGVDGDNDDNDDGDNDNDNDDSDDDEDDDDSDNDNNNKENKLSFEDKEKVRDIFQKVNSWTATNLKSFLKNLKSLRTIDGVAIFEDISLSGKKDELQKKVRVNVYMIYLGEVTVKSGGRSSWCNWNRTYKDNIDFDDWKLQINQFINMSSQSGRKSKSNKNALFPASLVSRLNACNKNQIIASIELLFKQEMNQNGINLSKSFEELLPKPNLQNIFKKHNVLINGISKAQPWTRYGSSSDDYCFKRCRSAINTAKRAIISDGNATINSKEWDTCLEYLVVSKNNIEKFPTWDNDSNNAAVRDLKKKLKIWYGKVSKGLGKNVNDTQKQRLKQIQKYLGLKQ